MPNRNSKYGVTVAQLLTCHIRKVMGKIEKVDGKESLHTAGGPTGY
jgi:hypothetical protein